eukprot:5321236-Ditylum_brightwellii.AAC.1
MAGEEAKAAQKHMASHLASKLLYAGTDGAGHRALQHTVAEGPTGQGEPPAAPSNGGWGRHGDAGAGETVGCGSPILTVSAFSRAHAGGTLE